MTEATAENVSTTPAESVTPPVNTDKQASPAVSPAQDLRNLQMLLVSGIFPGNVAPQVVAGYNLLEKMAIAIEAAPNASK